MYATLLAAYGTRQWWPAETPFEVILGAYLTQATAWRNVERTIANLRSAGVLTVEGIRTISEESLRQVIRPSGFVMRKAASIKAFVQFLDEIYGGSLDNMAAQSTDILRPQLLALPGVGPETADAILLYALGHPVFVVDEYLRRVATRHELVPMNARYAELQVLGDRAVASGTAEETARHANELHALIVEVGKRHCGTTPRCEECPLERFFAVSPTITLYVATTSAGKLRDFDVAAKSFVDKFQFAALPGIEHIPPPLEDAATFKENAVLKAIAYSRHAAGRSVLADDSGLEVDALDGAPGVRSARYAADAAFELNGLSADERNNLLLLKNLRGVPTAVRTARYRCVLAAARDGECIALGQGAVEGMIMEAPRGTGGFGYDPLFYLPDTAQTMAEISLEEKLRISHRGQALRALMQAMSALIG